MSRSTATTAPSKASQRRPARVSRATSGPSEQAERPAVGGAPRAPAAPLEALAPLPGRAPSPPSWQEERQVLAGLLVESLEALQELREAHLSAENSLRRSEKHGGPDTRGALAALSDARHTAWYLESQLGTAGAVIADISGDQGVIAIAGQLRALEAEAPGGEG